MDRDRAAPSPDAHQHIRQLHNRADFGSDHADDPRIPQPLPGQAEHDGIGIWLAARWLNAGGFVWPSQTSPTLRLSRVQFDALVLGLPWQRVGEAGIIRVL
jgi:hypothetical protein